MVRRETRQGKGHVVRRMFADVEADIYVLVDGDDTYDAPSAAAMLRGCSRDRLDMVIGAARRPTRRPPTGAGHRIGNRVLTGIVGAIFGPRFNDMLSGYRVFSRRFVKSFPALRAASRPRPNSPSMRSNWACRSARSTRPITRGRPGSRLQAAHLERRPAHPAHHLPALKARAAAAVLRRHRRCCWRSLGRLRRPGDVTYLETGLVPRLPTAVLATGLMLLAFLSGAIGLVLDTVTRGRREIKRLAYLALRAPGEERRRR